MYCHGLLQTNVLITFFIPISWAEAITWESFFPKWDPGSAKERSHLLRMKRFTCNRKI